MTVLAGNGDEEEMMDEGEEYGGQEEGDEYEDDQ